MRLSFLDNRFELMRFFDSDIVIPKYVISWLNDDGTELEIDSAVPEGEMPSYKGTTPTKPSTATYWYEFSGWNPTPVRAVADAVYTAVFTEHLITYPVSWYAYDGVTVLDSQNVPANQIPVYSGEIPTKPSTAQYRYVFAGWDPVPAAVDGPISYVATFTELPNVVTATFIRATADGGGTLETQNNVPYNSTPVYGGNTPTTTKGANYAFVGWKPALGPITENTTFTAVFRDTRPLTVQFLERTLTEFER